MHLGTVTLETERLILRKFRLEDAPDMYANWASDDEVTRYLIWPTHAGPEVSREVIGGWLEGYDDPRQYLWCLEHKGEGRAIGSLGMVDQNAEGTVMEVGYCLGRAWWRQGLMSEALRAVLDFMFERVGVLALEARIDERNIKSAGLLKKCGFKFNRIEAGAGRNNLGVYDPRFYRISRG